jgi:hypothetical protein
MGMNLYRILYLNRHNARLIQRDKLFKRLNNQPFFTASDINAIISYKGLKPIEDSRFFDVKDLTNKAFSTPELSLKFRSLTRMRGIGMTLASEILAFQSPYKHAALSHKVWNTLVKDFGMKGEEKKPEDDFAVKDYETYLLKISSLAEEHGMKLADVEFVLNYLYDKK